MSAFGIPDADAEMGALAIGEDTRLEAWMTAAEQANSEQAITALEARLYRRLELLRDRGVSPRVEREALAMLHERRLELAAQAASRAGTGGNRGPMMRT